MSLKHNKKGETLIETIIALSVLAISIAVVSTVMLNSIRNMQNAKNRIIAINIAREGIEGMRNIRDTNWLLFSDRLRECWNHHPNYSQCEGLNPILPGQYVLYQDVQHRWKLSLADADPGVDSELDTDQIPDNDLDLAALFLVDIDPLQDSNGDGILDNDLDTYNHVKGLENPLGQESQSTVFRRYLIIEYLDNDGVYSAISQTDPPFDSINTVKEWKDGGLDPDQLNRMRLTCIVEWDSHGNTHRAQLKTILTDHLYRTELES